MSRVLAVKGGNGMQQHDRQQMSLANPAGMPLGMGHPRGQVATVAALPALRISSAPIQISYSVMSCEPHEGHDLPAVQPADGRWSSSVQPTPGARKGIAEMP